MSLFKINTLSDPIQKKWIQKAKNPSFESKNSDFVCSPSSKKILNLENLGPNMKTENNWSI